MSEKIRKKKALNTWGGVGRNEALGGSVPTQEMPPESSALLSILVFHVVAEWLCTQATDQ